MTTIKNIPLKARPQSFLIQLAGTVYRMTWRWCSPSVCWLLDIDSETGTRLVSSIPVITGLDILSPFRHIGIVGSLVVQTDNDPDAVPTFTNLGSGSHVYYIV